MWATNACDTLHSMHAPGENVFFIDERVGSNIQSGASIHPKPMVHTTCPHFSKIDKFPYFRSLSFLGFPLL